MTIKTIEQQFKTLSPKNYIQLTEYIQTFKPEHFGHIKKYGDDLYYIIPYLNSETPTKKTVSGSVATEKFNQVRIKMDKELLTDTGRRNIILDKIKKKVSEVPVKLLPKIRRW